MTNYSFYIIILIAIVLGFALIKKVTTCLIRTIVTLVIIAALAAIYFLYFR